MDSGEECDPTVSTNTCAADEVCGAVGTPVACRCVSEEVCGNCIDDDGDGLTDFEAPVCCAGSQRFVLGIQRGRLRPRGNVSKFRLKARLEGLGPSDVNPRVHDVFLQIRPTDFPADALCARVPAARFTQRGRTFKFRDPHHTAPSAKGIDALTVVIKPAGSFLSTSGRRVQGVTPSHVISLDVTVGFLGATITGDKRCAAGSHAVTTGSRGGFKFP